MVNSASASIAEFKSQQLGRLMSGTGAMVSAPTVGSTSLSDTASQRLARSAPKKSSTAFMQSIRESGARQHQSQMQGYQAKREAQRFQGLQGAAQGGSTSYRLPGGGGRAQTGGPRGAYGLTVPAANAFGQLSGAYAKRFGGGLTVNSGGRTYQEQVVAYNKMLAGGPKAAPPGTSLHESGIAVDIGGPITNAGSAQHAWLRQNAAQFKWYWVGQKYGEPWHWEYHPEWN
jgi:hypothetical protein